jgi:caffeoyl-CoA O-methyltransferase
MSTRGFLPLSDELHDYIVAHSRPLDEVQERLVERTGALGAVSRMQIGHDQSVFMTMLTKLLGVRMAVEVGTFTGYSSLAIATGLPADGRLVCCDISDEWTLIARDAWREAGVDDRIELHIAPALDTLRSLPNEEHIDLAFIDADKSSYQSYFDELLPRLRPNAVILVDNTLWSGQVLDPNDTTTDTVALRAFNASVAADTRVEVVILPIGDGLSMIRKL